MNRLAVAAAPLAVLIACEEPLPRPPAANPVSAVVIQPPTAEIDTGSTQIFTAIIRDSQGNVLTDRAVSWSSSDTFTATVSATGMANGRRPGMSLLTAQSEGVSARATLFVIIPIVGVGVEPSNATIVPGAWIQLRARVVDASGDTVPRRPTWSSSDSTRAIVDSLGGVKAIAPGAALITAASRGVMGSAMIAIVAPRFLALAAGVNHTCGIATDLSAWCWGDNDNYQLGRYDVGLDSFPRLVSGGGTWRTLAGGARHGCGIAADSTAYCWGEGHAGQLGFQGGQLLTTADPTPVDGPQDWSAISTGSTHSCGVTSAGGGFCWGFGRFGELGDGDTLPRPTPEAIAGPTLRDVSAGTRHTCAVTLGGNAMCWGATEHGALGGALPTASCLGVPCHPVPSPVSGGLTFGGISAGQDFTCGVTTAAIGYCWGFGAVGQLGDDSTGDRATPHPVAGGLSLAMVQVRGAHACGLTTAGAVYCWGNGIASPTLAPGGYTFAMIAVGRAHACGLTTDAVAYCWGANTVGQLGDGTTTDRPVPVRVLGQPPP